MLRLGITGGIGSGKTMVCSIFEQLGVPVYNADTKAKWLVNNNAELKTEIISNFGANAFKDNLYDTAYMRGVVFKDKDKLALLNSIIHPAVFKDWEQFCEANKNHTLVIKEAAIMLETESKNTVDKIVLVYAPEQIRIDRVISRDRVNENELKSKMKTQMPEEEKLKLADYVIYNDGTHSLIEQVRNLYLRLISTK